MLGLSGGADPVGRVGKYPIVLPLGQGGTADVYLAVADGPSGFTKLVVVKVLRKNLAGDGEFRRMFMTEARLAARLQHPNIVQTNEVIDVDGAPVLVMEYLDGQPLSQVITRGKHAGFSLSMQLRVLADALAGLHAAHELADFDGTPLGVVHRDVSPHNLFVTVQGQAKVLDFGIAKLSRSLVETDVGTVKGKLRYMAPEQIAGGALDRRADIYPAGVILWEALTGERMWKAASEADIRARVLAGDLPGPEALRSDAPPELARICRRALSRAPGDRYPTARAMADDLEATMARLGLEASHRAIGATVAGLFEDVRNHIKRTIEVKLGRASLATGLPVVRVTSEISPEIEAATPVSTSNPAARRRLAVRLGAGAGVLALGAAAALVWPALSSRKKPRAWTPAAASPPPSAGAIGPAAVTIGPIGPAGPPSRPTAPARSARAGAGPAKPTVKRSVPASETSATDVAAAAVAPPPAPPDCAHPFFVDGEGIKRLRPECM